MRKQGQLFILATLLMTMTETAAARENPVRCAVQLVRGFERLLQVQPQGRQFYALARNEESLRYEGSLDFPSTDTERAWSYRVDLKALVLPNRSRWSNRETNLPVLRVTAALMKNDQVLAFGQGESDEVSNPTLLFWLRQSTSLQTVFSVFVPETVSRILSNKSELAAFPTNVQDVLTLATDTILQGHMLPNEPLAMDVVCRLQNP